ncbi:glycosyltransferase [bacterium]|nr:glycosyltransferase [bacterium]
MRIMHVGKYYPPYRGGMETALQALAEGQAAAGAAVSVVVAGGGSEDVREVLGGEGGGSVVLLRAGVAGTIQSQPLTLGLPALLRREIAGWRPDIVHLHLPNPLAAAAWLALAALPGHDLPPLAVWYHADITRQRLGRRLVSPLLQGCLRRATGIAVASGALRDGSPVLASHRDRVAVLPFGLPLQPWSEVEPRRDGPFLFVGRLVPYKGGDVLLRALARVPGAELVLVGEGPCGPGWAALVDELGLGGRVRFAGTLDETGIAARLGEARALVLPSVDESEAFGLVQLEAMAAGVPVVATDLPTGVPEVGIPGETGLLVSPGDVDGLAAALARLHGDAALRRRLGEAGRRRFRERFTREKMIERTLAWYGTLQHGGATSP